jgi:hypothetical protein
MSNSTNEAEVSSSHNGHNRQMLATDLFNVNLSQDLSQQISITNLKNDHSVNLPTQVGSPDGMNWQSHNTVQSPMVSLNDSSTSYGRRVLHIDPKRASDKFREFATNTSIGLLSPTYAHSPTRSTPPLGSVLKTPPDLTPTRISGEQFPAETPHLHRAYINDLGKGSFAPARSPAITKSINDFINSLPSITQPQFPVTQSPIAQSQFPTTQYPIDQPQFPTTQSPIVQSSITQSSITQSQFPVTQPLGSTPEITSPSFRKSTPPVKSEIETIDQDDMPKLTQEKKIEDAKKKADYRVKFSILREAYPQMDIPEPKEDESIDEIEAGYKQYVKRIHVESSVEQNKIYLLILWLIIDVVGTRFFKLPFNGRYVKSQFKYMQKYQMLLIELGERSYVEGTGEGWPVEFRLLAMAVFHGVIFALVQMLASKLGGGNAANDKMADDFREVIDNFLTQNKGADVLRRAEQATSDHPPPPSATQNASPPLGDLGNMIGNFMPMLMNMFGGGGGGNDAAQPSAPKPQLKKPTTFGARHRKGQTSTTENT